MSNRFRTLVGVAIALVLSTSTAAAMQTASTGTMTDPGRPEQPGRPDEPGRPDGPPPGHEKRPDRAGGPGGPGDDGSDPEPPPAPTPMDYIAQADQLSQPVHAALITDELELETHDGATVYVEVTRPDPAVSGATQVPVILEASPYHGTIADRDGTRIFPDPVDADGNPLGLTGYFAPRGYAVAVMDLRGTGRSSGCLDHLAENDAQDLVTVIEHLAAAEWSNGRVGMTGHSYVGSTPSVAAAMAPEGLVTIAPSAGLASMYDHQFHNGVPWNLQWIGPMIAYEGLAFERDLPPGTPGIPVVTSGNPGDNWNHRGGQPNPQTGCGLPNSAAVSGTGQVTGQYESWHAARDWSQGAADADIPVFMIHGVHDNAARIPASEWFFGNRFDRTNDKVWIGQWDHGSTNGRCGDAEGVRTLHPTCRFEQFQYAIHAWFDHHLLEHDVDTGPAVEAFLNAEEAVDVTAVIDPETLDSKVLATDAWHEATSFLELHPDASDMSLGTTPAPETASASFETGAEAILANLCRGSVTFTSAPMAKDTVLLGLSDLQLHASVTNPLTHLVATLWRVDTAGNREPVDFCAIQPQLRDGIDTVSPVVPGEVMALDTQCFTVAQWVPAGQTLELEVSTGSQHHASFGDTGQVTVHTGPDLTRYQAPSVEGAVLHDDVPLRTAVDSDGDGEIQVGEAQAPASGTVVVPAPGGGVIVEPVTAAAFEFDIIEGFDNATLEVLATPAAPADVDLSLQRLDGDTWSEDLAAGESGELDRETLVAGRQEPGRYRIVVHSWAGPPNQVDVTVTFFNGDGGAGSAS